MSVCRYAFCALVWLVLYGCAGHGHQVLQKSDYRYSRDFFDVTVAWDRVNRSGQTSIDGYLRNNRYFLMENPELWIALLDAGGRETATKAFLIIPSSLKRDESALFSVDMGMTVPLDGSLRFLYRYRAIEDNEGGEYMLNSFEAPLR